MVTGVFLETASTYQVFIVCRYGNTAGGTRCLGEATRCLFSERSQWNKVIWQVDEMGVIVNNLTQIGHNILNRSRPVTNLFTVITLHNTYSL